MVRRDLVVVGASAGGIDALMRIVSGLPPDFPAAMLIVVHQSAARRSALPDILRRIGDLPAKQAEDGDNVQPGQLLVAAPDRHLIVHDGRVTLSRGPRENGHRPAVDVLFRSAARSLGPRVVGLVLSGALDDGAAGLVAVTQRGGVGVVQDPDDSVQPGMPNAAIEAVTSSRVLPTREIAPALLELVREQLSDDVAGSAAEVTPLMSMEVAMADMDPNQVHELDPPGEPAGLSCPDCQGTLFRITEGDLTRFRCRVGHAWSPESLVAQQTVAVETALWMGLRSLEEKAALSQNMSKRAAEKGHNHVAASFEERADEAQNASELLRQLIAHAGEVPPPVEQAAGR